MLDQYARRAVFWDRFEPTGDPPISDGTVCVEKFHLQRERVEIIRLLFDASLNEVADAIQGQAQS